MTDGRMTEKQWRLCYHNELIEDLSENIVKIHALAEIALGSNLSGVKHSTMLNYWDILNDLVKSAKSLCEELSDKS